MATKAARDPGQLSGQGQVAGVDGRRSVLGLPVVLRAVGYGVLVVLMYGAILYGAVVIVGDLVGYVSGLPGAILLLSVGVVVLATAPSVAHWTLTRVLELENRG